jgi:hypothetical protein
MARCWERRVASLVVLCVCAAGQIGGVGFTYRPATCVPAVTFCAPYTRRNNCVVRNCGNRVIGSVSGGSSGGSGTNIAVSGRFVPKYTGRFSAWRGLRYGKQWINSFPLSHHMKNVVFDHTYCIVRLVSGVT